MSTTTPAATFIMKHLVRFSAVRPLAASAEFRIGIRSVPHLADHGFQDMVVLPGSFYIETALCVDRELSKSVSEKAFGRHRVEFGVPPLGGSGAIPSEGGTPNPDSRTRAKRVPGLVRNATF